MALGFLTVDLAFFGTNLPKVPAGGWFPLVVGGLVFLLLSTWKRGRDILQQKLQEKAMPVDEFLEFLQESAPTRVAGTAVYMTTSHQGVPLSLLNNLKHNKALHENVIILSVITEPVPRVAPEKRRNIRKLADSMFRISLHYGFAESPNIPKALRSSSREIEIDPANTYYFLSRETLIPCPPPPMVLWRLRLFIAMARNAGSASRYFRLPTERVVELGSQVLL